MESNRTVWRNVRDLAVWQKSMVLVEQVYRLSDHLPSVEKFGLVSQMCRAAISIPSNIAEGHGRGGRVEFGRFIRIALGSLRELETQLMIAERLKLCPSDRVEPVLVSADEVGRMLTALRDSPSLH